MTCIAAWRDNGRVYVGADSAGVGGYTLEVRSDEKVFRVGPYVIGFTSSFRMGQVLRYSTTLPAPEDWDVNRFMATRFVDAVRGALKTAGSRGATGSLWSTTTTRWGSQPPGTPRLAVARTWRAAPSMPSVPSRRRRRSGCA